MAYFKKSGPEAESIDQVSEEEVIAKVSGFATFNFTESGGSATYDATLTHTNDDKVRIALAHTVSGHEIAICEVENGQTVIIYPGSKSQANGFPRMEITHGDPYLPLRILSMQDIILARYS